MTFEQQALCEHCRTSFRANLDISDAPVDDGVVFECKCPQCGEQTRFRAAAVRKTDQSDASLPVARRIAVT